MNFCLFCKSNRIIFFTAVNLYKYYLCINCNTLQSKYIKRYYSYLKSFKYKVNKKTETRLYTNAHKILRFVEKNVISRNNLLDIGSGYGYFLNKARNSFKNVIGLEPSFNLYASAIKKFKLNIRNQDFENYYKWNNKTKFDAIVLIHVIEHVYDPKRFLNLALNLLKPGGILYLETPNLDSFLFKAEQQHYTFLTPPDHKYILSFKSFNHLLNLESKRFSSYFYTYSFNEHIVTILKIFIISLFRKFTKKETKALMLFSTDRTSKCYVSNIKKSVFFILFHKIIAPIIRPLIDRVHKGTFLQLYIKKNY